MSITKTYRVFGSSTAVDKLHSRFLIIKKAYALCADEVSS